jgi:hypothetical protein
MKKRTTELSYDLRPNYTAADVRNPQRGRHYRDYWAGRNVVVLDPDVAAAFTTHVAVNDALRAVLAARAARPTRRPARRPARRANGRKRA